MNIISNEDFTERLKSLLVGCKAKAVTGPGRSGAIASVYASHILGIPYIPYGQPVPDKLRPLLIVDTAMQSGRTLRKDERKYGGCEVVVIYCYKEPPRVVFWYEAQAGV